MLLVATFVTKSCHNAVLIGHRYAPPRRVVGHASCCPIREQRLHLTVQRVKNVGRDNAECIGEIDLVPVRVIAVAGNDRDRSSADCVGHGNASARRVKAICVQFNSFWFPA